MYSKIENCQNATEIKHPGIRECLKYLNCNKGLEIIHQGDLPARSGMGSSSSFIVGLLLGLYALRGVYKSKYDLFKEAIHIEHNLMKENVGSQDQVAAAVGGLNVIEFDKNTEIRVNPIPINYDRRVTLNNQLQLYFTGFQRNATDVVSSYVTDLNSKSRQLRLLKELVNEGVEILAGNAPISDFGRLMHESWLIKKTIGNTISNNKIESIYQNPIEAGATGGKLLGAGGGGLMLLSVDEDKKLQVREALKDLILVPFQFDTEGAKIIYHLPQKADEEIATQNNALASRVFKEMESIVR